MAESSRSAIPNSGLATPRQRPRGRRGGWRRSGPAPLAEPLATMRPRSRTWPRSATARALRTFCSTSSTVVPASAMRRAIASSSSTMRGARPSDGSSSRSRRGAGHHGARHGDHLLLAAAHRAGELAGALGEARKVAQHCARRRRALAAGDQPAAELEVLGDASSARTAAGPRRRAPGRAAPPRSAAPAAASRRRARRRPARGSRPAIAFSSVVLPAPFGPSTTVRPGSTSQVEVAHDEEAAVAGADAVEVEARAHAGSAISSPR